ncbi:DUF2026 family protein [Pseudomonas piscis]|uniref:DUF2026 family protein n=1 Tax=Pseudomonas piscis TaxID=2614538 RepID=UPI000A10F73A|nr:DUF2026 family protein [Pseudomonas piscis]
MKKNLGTLIPLQDYLRVHRVIRSTLDMAGAETAHACWFFSVAGAAILRKYYKKDAHPVAGDQHRASRRHNLRSQRLAA